MGSLVLPYIEIKQMNEDQNSSTNFACTCNSPISTFGNDFTKLLQSAYSNMNNNLDRKETEKPDHAKEGHLSSESNDEEVSDTQDTGTVDGLDVHVASKGNILEKQCIYQEINVREIKIMEQTAVCSEGKKDDATQYSKIVGKKYEVNAEMQNYYSIVVNKKNKHKKDKFKDTKTKKSRWKRVPVSDVEFMTMSLFPRPVVCDHVDMETSVSFSCFSVEEEIEEIEVKTKPYSHLMELEGKFSKCQYIRRDRDRKKQKAHIQVKHKYCNSVKNNKGRTQLFINHRIYKMISLEIRATSYLPNLIAEKILCKRQKNQQDQVCKRSLVPHVNNTYQKPVAPQNLAYAIDQNNAPTDLDSALLNLLIRLQHRDVTPEDYDMLLRLDESVAPKTLSENVLESFQCDVVDESQVNELCSVCMENYVIGDARKHLPCGHVFHSHCIDMWLKNSSMNCPVDNLPLDPS